MANSDVFDVKELEEDITEPFLEVGNEIRYLRFYKGMVEEGYGYGYNYGYDVQQYPQNYGYDTYGENKENIYKEDKDKFYAEPIMFIGLISMDIHPERLKEIGARDNEVDGYVTTTRKELEDKGIEFLIKNRDLLEFKGKRYRIVAVQNRVFLQGTGILYRIYFRSII